MVWGVYPLLVPPTDDFNDFQFQIMKELKQNHVFEEGDKLVIVIGRTAGISGTTDTVKIVTF